MPLIGIDIGTTGCKCVLFDFEGNIKNQAYREYSFEKTEPGLCELDPQKVWDSVKIVVHEAAKDQKLVEITALAVSSFGESGVPIDKNGKILYNSIMYTDNRGINEAIYLKDKLGASRIMEITGLPVHSMYTVNKLMWIKKNLPDVYDNMWKFLLFQDFIAYMFTGQAVIDYSLASRTMAFDISKKVWSDEILEAAGISKEHFSKPVLSGTPIGSVTKEIAEELGLPYDTLVLTGGHDQACATLGAGVINDGEAVNGMGTADCITTVFNKPVFNKKMLESNFNCEPHVLDNMYISLSYTFTGGSLLKWYRDCFGASDVAEAARRNISVYNLLDDKAAQLPTNILILPHFSGSGTPYMDPFSKGAVVGLTLDTTAPIFYRALMEGVAYEMRYNLERLEKAGVWVKKLRAVGGGAKSKLWLQIKADIMGRTIETLHVEEAGTLGTAIIAGRATGIYPSDNDAIKMLVKGKDIFYPEPSVQTEYEEKYQKYKKMYKSIKRIYE